MTSPLAALVLPALLSSVGNSPSPVPGSDGSPQEERIWGGQNTSTCGWPNVVAVGQANSYCSGVLVHPQLVVSAAHCGAGLRNVIFGPDLSQPELSVGAECSIHPSWSWQGDDLALCVLDEAIEAPTTPLVHPCELEDYLSEGQQVALVGFGADAFNEIGPKRWGLSDIVALGPEEQTFDVGGEGSPVTCAGDSGGPALVRGTDGIWRVLGIASTKESPDCDDAPGTFAIPAVHFDWLTEASPFDLDTCRDEDGEFTGGSDCSGFLATQAGSGSGTWPQACASTDTDSITSGCSDAETGGTEGGESDGGDAGSGAGVGLTGGDAGGPPLPITDSGCACSLGHRLGSGRGSPPLPGALAGLLFFLRRRRRD